MALCLILDDFGAGFLNFRQIVGFDVQCLGGVESALHRYAVTAIIAFIHHVRCDAFRIEHHLFTVKTKLFEKILHRRFFLLDLRQRIGKAVRTRIERNLPFG